MAGSVKERLIQFLEAQHISKAEFGRTIGVSSAYVTSMRKSIDNDKLKSIALNYPSLNIDWLLFGEGTMLKGPYERINQILARESSTEEEFAQKSTTILSALSGFMYSQAKKRPGDTKTLKQWIKPLLEAYPQYSEEWIITGEGSMLKSNQTAVKDYSVAAGVPYYAVDFLAGFELVMNDQTAKPDGFISFPNIRGAQYWVDISGKSMSPLIDPGDVIAIRKVEDWPVNILYGEVYALVTEQYRTVKRIRKSDRGDWIRLVPENPDYDAQDIPVTSVRAVFQVLGCAKKIF